MRTVIRYFTLRRVITLLLVFSQIFLPIYRIWDIWDAIPHVQAAEVPTADAFEPSAPLSLDQAETEPEYGNPPQEEDVVIPTDVPIADPDPMFFPNVHYAQTIVDTEIYNDGSLSNETQALGEPNGGTTNFANTLVYSGTGNGTACIIFDLGTTITAGRIGIIAATDNTQPGTKTNEWVAVGWSVEPVSCSQGLGQQWLALGRTPSLYDYHVARCTNPGCFGTPAPFPPQGEGSHEVRYITVSLRNHSTNDGTSHHVWVDAVYAVGKDEIDYGFENSGSTDCDPCLASDTSAQTEVHGGGPINIANGHYTYSQNDISRYANGPSLGFRRVHAPTNMIVPFTGPFPFQGTGTPNVTPGLPFGWTHNYALRLYPALCSPSRLSTVIDTLTQYQQNNQQGELFITGLYQDLMFQTSTGAFHCIEKKTVQGVTSYEFLDGFIGTVEALAPVNGKPSFSITVNDGTRYVFVNNYLDYMGTWLDTNGDGQGDSLFDTVYFEYETLPYKDETGATIYNANDFDPDPNVQEYEAAMGHRLFLVHTNAAIHGTIQAGANLQGIGPYLHFGYIDTLIENVNYGPIASMGFLASVSDDTGRIVQYGYEPHDYSEYQDSDDLPFNGQVYLLTCASVILSTAATSCNEASHWAYDYIQRDFSVLDPEGSGGGTSGGVTISIPSIMVGRVTDPNGHIVEEQEFLVVSEMESDPFFPEPLTDNSGLGVGLQPNFSFTGDVETGTYGRTTSAVSFIGFPSDTIITQRRGEGMLGEPNYIREGMVRIDIENRDDESYVWDGNGNLKIYRFRAGTLYEIEDVETGEITRISFTGNNLRPAAQRDGNGQVSLMNWSESGSNLTQVTDNAGAITYFGYDGNVNGGYPYGSNPDPLTVSCLGGASTNANEAEHVTCTKDAAGHVTLYEYHAAYSDLPIRITRIRGSLDWLAIAGDSPDDIVEFAYDSNRNLIEVHQLNDTTVGTDDSYICYSYTLERLRASMTLDCNGANPQTSYFYYDILGRMTLAIDTAGRTTGMVYDERGNVLRIVQNYFGTDLTSLDDSALANALNAVVHNPNIPDQNLVSEMSYDLVDNMIEQSLMLTAGVYQTTHYDYDYANRPIRVVQNYQDGIYDSAYPDTDLVSEYLYDANDNTIGMRDTLGRLDWTCYDSQNRPVRQILNLDANGLSDKWAINSYACDGAAPLGDEETNLSSELFYDAAGNLISVIDPLHQETRFIYDRLNRPVATVYNYEDGVHDFANEAADTDIIELSYYDVLGNVTRTVDPLGRVTVMCYDDLQRVTRQIINTPANPQNRYLPTANVCGASYSPTAVDKEIVTNYVYNERGQVQDLIDSDGRIIHYEYDNLGRVITEIANYVDGIADSNISDEDIITRYVYDIAGNIIETVQYADTTLSLRSVACYDAFNRPVRQVTNTNLDYASACAVSHESYNGTNLDSNIITEVSYDTRGRVVEQIDANGNVTNFLYDNMGRNTLVTTYPAIGLSQNTESFYDGLGNLRAITISMINAPDRTTSIYYDGLYRPIEVISPEGNHNQTIYDGLGRAIYRIQGDGEGGETDITTYYQYDSVGRLILSRENVSSLAVQANTNSTTDIQTIYDYDVVGNLHQVHLPNAAIINYGYDAMNRRIFADGPLLGSQDTWQMTYDRLGRQKTLADPMGRFQELDYDAVNRLSGRQFENVVGMADESFNYDIRGRQLSMQDQTGITSYTYDELNRLSLVTDPFGREVAYSYDSIGLRRSMTTTVNGDSQAVNYAYDGNNRLSSVSDWDAASNDVTYSYNNANQVEAMSLPNGVTAYYSYDNDGRLIELRYEDSSSEILMSYSYEYDAFGNRTAVNENITETVLSPGLYQAEATHYFDFTGTWNEQESTLANAGAYLHVSEQNATMRFLFDGVGLVLYRHTDASFSEVEICIDGTAPENCRTTYNGVSFGWQVSFQVPYTGYDTVLLDPGIHEVTITTLGANPFEPDAILILGANHEEDEKLDALTAGRYEDNDPRINYSGSWNRNASSTYASENRYAQSTSNASYYQFRVASGHGAVIYQRVTGTLTDITICSRTCQTYTPIMPEIPFVYRQHEWQFPAGWRSPILVGSGLVTISSSSGAALNLDEIVVYEGTHIGEGRWEYDERAGDTTGRLGRSTSYSPASGGRHFMLDGYNWLVSIGIQWPTVIHGTDAILYLDAQTVDFDVYVRVDGVLYYSYQDTYSTSLNQTGIAIPLLDLGDGQHEIRVYGQNGQNGERRLAARDASGNLLSTLSIDVIEVIERGNPLTAGQYYEDSHDDINYIGGWAEAPAGNAHGGTHQTVASSNGLATFDFVGTGFTLYRRAYSTYGQMSVCVDDLPCQNVANNAPAGWQMPVSFNGYTPDVTHTVRIRPLTNATITLDGVVITDSDVLQAGNYPEYHPAIYYNGTWTTTLNDTNAQGEPNTPRKLYAETTTNDSLSFQFEGTGFEIIRRTVATYGTIRVCIDDNVTCNANTGGILIANTTAPIAWGETNRIDGLPSGLHNVIIYARDNKIFALDGLNILDNPTEALAIGSYEQDNPNFIYNGRWTGDLAGLSASGDSYRQTVNANDRVDFDFVGTGFTLYRRTASGYGTVSICVDGTNCQTINNASPAGWQMPVSFNGLSAGTHHATITLLSGTFAFDKVTIVDAAVPLQAGIYQEYDARINYSGTWTPTINADAAAANSEEQKLFNDTQLDGATMSFTFEGDAFAIYRYTNTAYGSMDVCYQLQGSPESPTCIPTANNSVNRWQNIAYFDVDYGIYDVTITNHGHFTPDYIRIYGEQVPLEIGEHEDNDSRIQYIGTWNETSSNSASGLSYQLNTYTGDAIEFDFEGSGVLLFRKTAATGIASMDITIYDENGVVVIPTQTITNTLLDGIWKVPHRLDMPSFGHYRIRIVAKGTGVNFDKVLVFGSPEVLVSGQRYQEYDPSLVYGGTWTTLKQNASADELYIQSTTVGSTLSFSFQGAGFMMARRTYSGYGNMQVCVAPITDPSTVTCELESNASVNRWQTPYVFDGSAIADFDSNQVYLVTITNQDTFLPDYIEIYDTRTPLELGEHEAEGDGIQRFGTIVPTPNNNAFGSNYLLFQNREDIVYFDFVGTDFTIHRQTNTTTVGSMEICVDGLCTSYVNNAANAWKVPLTIHAGEYGLHTVSIKANSALDLNLDRITTYDSRQPLQAGIYEESHAGIVYSAGWTLPSYNANNADGFHQSTTTVGSSAEFYFQGSGFDIYRRTYTTYGTMNVLVYEQTGSGEALVLNRTLENNLVNAWKSPVSFTGFDENSVYRVVISLPATGTLWLDRLQVQGNLAPLYPGSYEDDNSNIQYLGTGWSEVPDTGNGGNYHRSTNQGDTAQFQFYGTGLILHQILASAYGVMEICVDSACYLSNTAGTTNWDNPILLSGFNAGFHLVTIRATSNAFIAVNRIEILNQASLRTLRAGVYEQNEANILYGDGIWSIKTAASGPSEGQYYQSTVTGNSMRFRFEGTGFTLYRRTASNYGTICIYIDASSTCQSYSNTTAPNTWQQPLSITGLPFGVHDLRIVVSASSTFEPDSLEIIGVPRILPLGYYEDNQLPSYGLTSTWTERQSPNASGGTDRYSSSSEPLTFRVVGAQSVMLYRYVDGTAGDLQITVDGIVTNVDDVAPARWHEPYVITGLDPALIHEISVKSLGAGVFYLDAVEVSDAEPVQMSSLVFGGEENFNLVFEPEHLTLFEENPTELPIFALPHLDDFTTGTNWRADLLWQHDEARTALGWFADATLPNSNHSLEQQAYLDFRTAARPVITFSLRNDAPEGANFVLELRRQESDIWETTFRASLDAHDWREERVFLDGFAGDLVQVRFRVETSETIIGDGFGYWLDDFRALDAMTLVDVPIATAIVLAPIEENTASPEVTETAVPNETVTPEISETVEPSETATTPAPVETEEPSETATTPAPSESEEPGETPTTPAPQTATVTGFTLLDPQSRQEIRPLMNGETIDLATLPHPTITIRADMGNGVANSLRFGLNENANYYTAEIAPFLIAGYNPNSNVYHPWRPQPGVYTITATAYSADGATGTASIPMTMTITIIDSRGNGNPGNDGAQVNLQFASICEGQWRVENLAVANLAFEWRVLGTSEGGFGVVAANGEAFFGTSDVAATVQLYLGGSLLATKANNGVACAAELPENTGDSFAEQQAETYFYQTGGSTSIQTINRRVEYDYDGMMRLTNASYYAEGDLINPVQTFDYDYDRMGNRTGITVFDGTNTLNQTFGYNEASQLLSSSNGQASLAYDYDLNGNRIRVSESGVSVAEYHYDVLDRLTAYTAYNQGIPDVQFEYGYNASGDRLSSTQLDPLTGLPVANVQYLLDMNTGLTEVLGEFSATSETYYLLGMDIIGQQQDGTWGYFGYDALGSVRQMTNSTGAVTYAANYDPYGSVLEARGTNAALGFAGEYSDVTGLIYLRARYMDPTTGTFLTRDPVWGMVGGSVTYNPYLYAHGNPINYTDPSGMFVCGGLCIAGIIIAASVVAGALGLAYDVAINQGLASGDICWDSVDWSQAIENGVRWGVTVGGVMALLAGPVAFGAGMTAGGLGTAAWQVTLGAVLGDVGYIAGTAIFNYLAGNFDPDNPLGSLAHGVTIDGLLLNAYLGGLVNAFNTALATGVSGILPCGLQCGTVTYPLGNFLMKITGFSLIGLMGGSYSELLSHLLHDADLSDNSLFASDCSDRPTLAPVYGMLNITSMFGESPNYWWSPWVLGPIVLGVTNAGTTFHGNSMAQQCS